MSSIKCTVYKKFPFIRSVNRKANLPGSFKYFSKKNRRNEEICAELWNKMFVFTSCPCGNKNLCCSIKQADSQVK